MMASSGSRPGLPSLGDVASRYLEASKLALLDPSESRRRGGLVAIRSLELTLDFRRLRPFLITRLIRLAVVSEPEELPESVVLDELDEPEELEEPIKLAKTPGRDSSSIRSFGIL